MGDRFSTLPVPQTESKRSPFSPASISSDSPDIPRPKPTMLDLNALMRLPSNKEKVSPGDFIPIRTIGKGSFGKVLLVKKRETEEYFALKILRKDEIVKENQVQHTLTEKRVLQTLDHPFIVNLHFAFQTEKELFLVLDFVNGGDLYYHLKKEGTFSVDRCRLYAAEITLAFEALHNRDIIYRDLKPENVLLASDGHIALTDFGLSKTNINKHRMTNTFCGTPEYLAPEMLKPDGHGKAVDWWTLGTLLYEMLTGFPPFFHENTNEMFKRILYQQLQIPAELPRDAQDILIRLLDRDPQRRLGGGIRDAADVKAHPFFASIDWEALFHKQITPPFIPKSKSPDDVSNIDPEFLSMPITDLDFSDPSSQSSSSSSSSSSSANTSSSSSASVPAPSRSPSSSPSPISNSQNTHAHKQSSSSSSSPSPSTSTSPTHSPSPLPSPSHSVSSVHSFTSSSSSSSSSDNPSSSTNIIQCTSSSSSSQSSPHHSQSPSQCSSRNSPSPSSCTSSPRSSASPLPSSSSSSSYPSHSTSPSVPQSNSASISSSPSPTLSNKSRREQDKAERVQKYKEEESKSKKRKNKDGKGKKSLDEGEGEGGEFERGRGEEEEEEERRRRDEEGQIEDVEKEYFAITREHEGKYIEIQHNGESEMLGDDDIGDFAGFAYTSDALHSTPTAASLISSAIQSSITESLIGESGK
ncbi:putative serine/threonine kinase [Monocercomonoides exilis]|uniref:putative serine/threonine kinase n=1 Tax=Monocercomonoides exilis TaxID=2049356 RepID=UPI0035594935|nr:putative serine/threonine kinase [Monocercomonoides exilis]|eukprot:MONOS_3220.1-p1 / transcript=MONOS_3220.1 / gene=MONOS_3220 / organism=Monocercomonoides_exilis_PA203 / gene_product=serine / transcript_product=serine / location=Mono_scaffold00074:38976-42150(+) / protein_length=694 / sequence_SO=supercontig / SO=protein_coding / is_pseudo=false